VRHDQNKHSKVENICNQFSQWHFYVPNSKTWTRWHVSSCYSRSPERACAINSIWYPEVVLPLIRSSDGNLILVEMWAWSVGGLLLTWHNRSTRRKSPPISTLFRTSPTLTGLLTYLLTYSMEQSPSWEANWFCS